VYDGLPVPADPYRYVDPPPGVRNGGEPLSADVTVQLVGGGNPPIDLLTSERPPQAEIELHHGDVDGNQPEVPPVADAVVSINPVKAPHVTLPAGRQYHGNVYEFGVRAAGVDLHLAPHSSAVVSLREPKSSDADPRIAVADHGEWRLLETRKGSDPGVLTARLPDLGYVTLLEGTSGFVAPSGRDWSSWLVLGGLVVLAAAALWWVRFTRRRARRS
jgi:hypothetical protein